jgi:hypothetical protein
LRHAVALKDEPFISHDMDEMLRQLGATPVTTFDKQANALKWLQSFNRDVLDESRKQHQPYIGAY